MRLRAQMALLLQYFLQGSVYLRCWSANAKQRTFYTVRLARAARAATMGLCAALSASTVATRSSATCWVSAGVSAPVTRCTSAPF